MSPFRMIPAVDAVLQEPALSARIARDGRPVAADAVRRASDELRDLMRRGGTSLPSSTADATHWIQARALALLAERTRPSLRPVINATGVIVHTNLGRAPLARAALEAASRVGVGYSNLEYDLDAGARGHRHVHAERLLCALTGAAAALVANNNAAATMLVVAALAAGREVIASRGELVEIGGGFRIPDVLAQSGAALREVGTTNRTRVSDYAAAIGERTGALLRVHPSNFRIEGFTERPPLGALAELAGRFDVPLIEDLGSGWLGLPDLPTPGGLEDEPSVVASLRAGVSLVTFSADKLLGGPQAGIVLGRRDLVDRARRHPLMRAVRADKVTYAALEATLALWAEPARRREIPVYRMLTATVGNIDARARALAGRLSALSGVDADVVDGHSTVGGGSAPESALETRLVLVRHANVSAGRLEHRLRAGDPPLIGRVADDRVVLDLRTVAPEDDDAAAAAVEAACQDPPLHRLE